MGVRQVRSLEIAEFAQVAIRDPVAPLNNFFTINKMKLNEATASITYNFTIFFLILLIPLHFSSSSFLILIG